MNRVALLDASMALSHEVMRSAREHGGWPGEADEDVNDASRRLVETMREVEGDAWLVCLNRTCGLDLTVARPMRRWDGGFVYNFAADYVAPRYDEELAALIEARKAAPYTNGHDDFVRLDAITARLRAIGGSPLFWT